MQEAWYNGPRKGALVALVGGPYATLDAAKAALCDDQELAEDKVHDIDYWTPWEAVCLRGPGPYVTLRWMDEGERPTLIERKA